MSESIRSERRGPVLVITIDRPEAKNSFDFAAADAMSRAIDALEADDELRAGVITGAGGVFSAGMDLKAFARGDVPYVERRGVFGVINEPPAKPLLAAVEGPALAGGFELMLVCDLVVAGSDSSFGIPEVKRGLLAASGGLIELARRLPAAVANELALTGDPIDAERAHQLGIVNRVCEPGEALDEAVALAERIGANAPLAVAASKRILREAHDWTNAEGFSRQGEIAAPVLTSEDAQEGARAFAERREPVWRGR